MPQASDYLQADGHPLRHIEQDELDAFRDYLRRMKYETRDIEFSDDMLEPLADALLMEAIQVLGYVR